MKQTSDFKPFEVLEVPLDAVNLIEASAGTGKTYSIAILVLRLLLEAEMLLKEILMVTFTKAAVAELEARVRLFVREAYRASAGEPIKDQTIIELVQRCMEAKGQEHTESLLRQAVLFLDETAVMTIHGFCQLTLSEFALETGQLFGAGILQDTTDMLDASIDEFWRNEVTFLPLDVLEMLSQCKPVFNRELIAKILKAQIADKKFMPHVPGQDYTPCDDDLAGYSNELSRLKAAQERVLDDFENYLKENRARLLEKMTSLNGRKLRPLIDFPQQLLAFVMEKADTKFIPGEFYDLLEFCEMRESYRKDIAELGEKIREKMLCHAINVVSDGFATAKLNLNLIGFDDMIRSLHQSLVSNTDEKARETLGDKLVQKYKAVFVDEFQDTDRMQYEIFEAAFAGRSAMFLIGDPKQSIYAWRTADLKTYFLAHDKADRRYSMTTNFRSSEAYIQAMNAFFVPEPEFDTFHFGSEPNGIQYIPVNSPKKNTKGQLLYKGQSAKTLVILDAPKKGGIAQAGAALVASLLAENSDYRIMQNGSSRAILAPDIGILVRTKSEAKSLRKELGRLRIPSVTVDDTNVLESDEARYLLYILEGILSIKPGNLNRALLSPLTGINLSQLLAADEAELIERFRNYRLIWGKAGIYSALQQFIHDFAILEAILSQSSTGERTLSNLYQLMELLHGVQSRKQFSPLELVAWLARSSEKGEHGQTENMQRIESDENAVRIVTIHSSKGLEYNIVLAPHLDFDSKEKEEFKFVRSELRNEFVSDFTNRLDDEHKALCITQNEQENRRLIYVAVTRGVFGVFIFNASNNQKSGLAKFIGANERSKPAEIIRIQAPEIGQVSNSQRTRRWHHPENRVARVFKLDENGWTRMSYTLLAEKHQPVTSPRRSQTPEAIYDRFVFHELRRGKASGNMLHYLFENASFSDASAWPFVVENAVRQFNLRPSLAPGLLLLLDEVFGTVFKFEEASFSLNEVEQSRQLHELEFDFSAGYFQPGQFEQKAIVPTRINSRYANGIQGLMNGKIDLFFEHQGLYYILDWKSNHLGDRVEDYSPAMVERAMDEHNYHLQYLIYTLAAKKYLQSRLPDFNYETQFGGVIYFFVRGMRKESQTGVYFRKPPAKEIGDLEMLLNGSSTES